MKIWLKFVYLITLLTAAKAMKVTTMIIIDTVTVIKYLNVIFINNYFN